MRGLRLVHDVLDLQLCDRRGEKIGRVDGLILEIRAGAPPRVAYIEAGGAVLARRLHPVVGRWAAALRRRWGSRDAGSTRIPWAAVRCIGTEIEVGVDGDAMPVMAWERWLREHIICHIPGAGRDSA